LNQAARSLYTGADLAEEVIELSFFNAFVFAPVFVARYNHLSHLLSCD